MTSHWKLFRKETIQVDLKAGTKGDVLAELVRLVVSAGGIAEERGDQVLAALEEREKIGSTGVGSGVAIPHVKHEAVAESVGALGIARRPIDFQSVDGEPCEQCSPSRTRRATPSGTSRSCAGSRVWSATRTFRASFAAPAA